MIRSYFYPKWILMVSFLVLGLNSVFSQTPIIEYKLQLLEADKWGVYARPNGDSPSLTTITGTAQVTVVMPTGFNWTEVTSVSGTWSPNAIVDGPVENPTKKYVSFGLILDLPKIEYQQGQQTLLFTFKRIDPCPDSIYLIDNLTDPFAQLPNSENSNPGNEASIFDAGNGTQYAYKGIYSPSAWSCKDCDSDGILNAFEDTDGNGSFAALDEDLDGDGFLDIDEDLDFDGNFDTGEDSDADGVLDPGEDLDGDLDLDPTEDLDQDGNWDQGEDLDHDGVLDLGEDRDLDGILDLDEDLNNNGVFEPGIEDIDGDGYFDKIDEDLDNDNNFDDVNEDFDGDGTVDVDEDIDNDLYLDPDVSNLCNPCDPIHPESAELALLDSLTAMCAGDATDEVCFKVTIEGGWPPYTVNWTDGTNTYAHTATYSGDTICFAPTTSVSVEILSIVDSFNCLLDTALGAPIDIEVHGPITVTDDPDPVVECHGNGTSFCITAANGGDGTIQYKWQVNTGSGWVDIQDGSVYDDTDLACVQVANVAGKHNYQYRCKIFTTVCDTVYSAAALLQVEGPISIATNPVNFTNCDSETASFTSTATNAGAVGTMNYTWQVNTGSGWADVTTQGDAIYGGINATTLTLSNIDTLMDGWQYRMKVATGQCDTVYSLPAILDVEGPIDITNDPDDFSNCAGNQVYFASRFWNPGEGTTFSQWQVADASTGPWTNLATGGVYTGTNGTHITQAGNDSLTIADVTGLNGKWYRVCYTTPTCSNQVYSQPAQLDVSGLVTFSDNPDDITVCSGNDTVFVATASIPQGTFTFGWQFSDDNGASWTDIDFGTMNPPFTHSQTGAVSSATDILTVSNVASMYGRRFRAVANALDCDTIYSNYAILSVEGPLSVNTHPTSVTECSTNGTTFTASFNNPGVTGSTIYRWQISVDGGATWNNLSNGTTYNGVNTTTLSISSIAGLHGMCYRLSARTNTCNIMFTNQACLTVEGPITISNANQPDDVTVCSGNSASFTSIAAVGTAGSLQYQWQRSVDNGNNWDDITATTDDSFTGGQIYTNFNTTTLNISNVQDLYGYCYRLAFFTAECNRVYSERACLTVEGPISITNQPDDITQCSGEAIIFGLQAVNSSPQGDDLTYQWQTSSDGNATWTSLVNDSLYNGVYTDTMSLSYTTGLQGNTYRCLIWTGTCSTIISDTVTLTVEGPVSVTDEPDNVTICSGSGTSFQATVLNAGIGALSYQWEVLTYDTTSNTYAGSWVNVNNGAIPIAGNGGTYSGATSTTLVISNVAGMYKWRYRMRFRTPNCDAQWTNYAVLTVEGPIGFEDQPDPVTVCSGSPTTFSVETFNTLQGSPVLYQWQVSPSGSGGPWFNLSNNSIYGGVKTSHLSISNVAGFNGYCYRVNIQTATCSAISSSPACLTVEGPINITTNPSDTTQCYGESVQFVGASQITPGNSGTMSYQWQYSEDCVNFKDITGPDSYGYSGWDSPVLTIATVDTLIDNYCYRLSVNTGVCNYVYSFSARLNVEGRIRITEQPVDFTNCSDKEAFFFSGAENGGYNDLIYQWQMSADNGVTWQDINQLQYTISGNVINFANINSDSLFISPITGLNGYRFRNVIWSSTCNTQTTNDATLIVEGPINFTLQPEDEFLCSGDIAQYTVGTSTTTGVGTVQYQWQQLIAGVWVDLTNSSPFSGVTTNQLTVNPVSPTYYNAKFRCKVKTPNCDWEFSDLANLFIEGPITISQQPLNASICSNRPHLFNTTISNPGYGQMIYRWQYSSNGGATWNQFPTNIGSFSSLGVVNPTDPNAQWQGAFGQDLNITNTDGLNGWMFRLYIDMQHCEDYTNEVTLTVRDKCTAPDCDLDNDGQINSVDLDDDNDQLADYWEWWEQHYNLVVVPSDSLNFPDTGPWNYFEEDNSVIPGIPGSTYIEYHRCLTDTDGDGLWDNQEDPDGDNITNGEETDGDGVFDGNPLDPCNPVLGPTCTGINLAIRVNLQGARMGVSNPSTDSLMRASLRSYTFPGQPNPSILVPLEEPYEDLPNFEHEGPDGGGNEVIGTSMSTVLFGETGKDAIVDWVFVELRSSTALDSVATTRSALLQRDGDVIDVNGDPYVRFPSAQAGAYYVVVRHRNHLGVMTGEAVELSPILQTIDFTSPTVLNNGTYAQSKQNNRNYMWLGDLNQDGRTIYQGPGNDILKLFTTVLQDPDNTGSIANFISHGYKVADVNLDGRSIYQGPANDRAMVLLNAILAHPANVQLIANYVILEQMP